MKGCIVLWGIPHTLGGKHEEDGCFLCVRSLVPCSAPSWSTCKASAVAPICATLDITTSNPASPHVNHGSGIVWYQEGQLSVLWVSAVDCSSASCSGPVSELALARGWTTPNLLNSVASLNITLVRQASLSGDTSKCHSRVTKYQDWATRG